MGQEYPSEEQEYLLLHLYQYQVEDEGNDSGMVRIYELIRKITNTKTNQRMISF